MSPWTLLLSVSNSATTIFLENMVTPSFSKHEIGNLVGDICNDLADSTDNVLRFELTGFSSTDHPSAKQIIQRLLIKTSGWRFTMENIPDANLRLDKLNFSPHPDSATRSKLEKSGLEGLESLISGLDGLARVWLVAQRL
jgi:hypothetical protein